MRKEFEVNMPLFGVWFINRPEKELAVVYLRLGKMSHVFMLNRVASAIVYIKGAWRQVKAEVKYQIRQLKIKYLGHFTKCAGIADEYYRFDEHVEIKCGDSVGGRGNMYCARCMKILRLEYPQGWHYYPGDVCKHGKYVGGCGADLMCGRCENE